VIVWHFFGRCSIPVGLLERLGGGSVAQYHHANKGDVGPPLVCLLVRSVANSAAVRAGSSSCCPKAWFSTVWRRCIHLWAVD